MATRSIGQQSHSSVTVEEKSSRSMAFCKVSKGWTCVITRTEGPDAGKTFVKCSGNCTCVVNADGTVSKDIELPQELENIGEGKTFCKCGEGWSCVVSKVEEPDEAKPFYECAGDCSCVTTA